MYMYWTLPWKQGAEMLLGILAADDVALFNPEGPHVASLVSIGFLVFRIDIIFNLEKIEEE